MSKRSDQKKRKRAAKLARREQFPGASAQDFTPVVLSNDAARKTRRWGFYALVVKPNDEGAYVTYRQNHSGFIFGNKKLANRTALEIQADMAELYENVESITVIPVPLETVAEPVAQQMFMLQQQTNVTQTALEMAVEDLIAGRSPSSLLPNQAALDYVNKAFAKLRPQHEPEETSGLVDAGGSPISSSEADHA